MPFDLGFNFRATAGFVTDGAEGVPVLAESYPHTYTNGNGYSINAGFTTAGAVTVNADATNDPRIAGFNYVANNGGVNPVTFRVDLNSGSAPGAGTYTVDLAFGDPASSQLVEFELRDDATVLIDGTNGGSGFTTGAADKFIDATLATVTATTAWTGATVTKTFASVTAYLNWCPISLSGFTTGAHFRLTVSADEGVPSGMLLLGAGRA